MNFMSAFSEAFTKEGLATWNIEYRCMDNEGGGWPGTFNDIGHAIDYLRVLAPKYHLDCVLPASSCDITPL
jgi:alpha/beta superfamily hydrolase